MGKGGEGGMELRRGVTKEAETGSWERTRQEVVERGCRGKGRGGVGGRGG